MSQRTLKPEECYFYCDPTQFEFETTETVPPLEGIIGQERAVRAMEFGLMVKSMVIFSSPDRLAQAFLCRR